MKHEFIAISYESFKYVSTVHSTLLRMFTPPSISKGFAHLSFTIVLHVMCPAIKVTT